MKTIKWFSIAAGLAFGTTMGALATASVGDQIYEAPVTPKCISPAQAGCYADCAMANGSWTGARADMASATAKRVKTGVCASGFRATTHGYKIAAPDDLPVGAGPVPVVGIVE